MQTVRRLYLYLMAGIGLAVRSVWPGQLLAWCWTGPARSAARSSQVRSADVRDRLSLACR